MKMLLNGKITEVFTLADIAKRSGKSVSNLRALMERNILPEANMRTPDSVGPKKTVAGYRVYSKQLIDTIVPILSNMKQGVKTSESVKQELRNAFMLERQTLNL